jgi:hypothetical protein
MAHFAQIDENDIVINVIRAEQDFINSGAVGNPEKWIQTSYNTYGGIHSLGGTPLRKNYAGIGYTYDSSRDAFIPPKPYASWTLNEDTCLWEAPTERPSFKHQWNEETQSWDTPE